MSYSPMQCFPVSGDAEIIIVQEQPSFIQMGGAAITNR